MSLPSIDLLRASSEWYLIRYRAASLLVSLFTVDRTDALALASLIAASYSIPVQVWFLAPDGPSLVADVE